MGHPDASVPVLIPAPERQDISRTALVERLPAREVAKILGVKVGTLAKWRRTKRGPTGWIYLSPTLVVYTAREVQRFLEDRKKTGGGVQ